MISFSINNRQLVCQGRKKGPDVNSDLLWNVWPSLALLSGVDHGLKMGAKCQLKQTAKVGVLLGATGDGKLRVQWDDMSDVSIRIRNQSFL